MPKSSAPSESRLAGIWLRFRQMAANISANGMVSDTIMAPRTLPRNRKRMIATRIIPSVRFRSTVVHRELHQVRAVEKRHHLHALGQNAVVQFVHFLVDALQHRVRIVALLQQHDSFHGVGIVHHRAVGQMRRFADLPQADLRALRHRGDVLDLHRRAVLRSSPRFLQCRARWCKGPATAR